MGNTLKLGAPHQPSVGPAVRRRVVLLKEFARASSFIEYYNRNHGRIVESMDVCVCVCLYANVSSVMFVRMNHFAFT
jgi:hypothetical protein